MELWLFRLVFCCLWLFLPPIAMIVLAAHVKASRTFRIGSAVLFLIWLPIIGGFVGFWSITTIFLDHPVRSSVSLDEYRVDFVEDAGFIEHERYFQIHRSDGKQARLSIDVDANKCQALQVQQVEAKTYFLCSGEPISERTSYVDRERRTVYAGWYQTEAEIENLPFE